MKYIINENTDPAYNHALEEYFLKETDEDIFTLWRNVTTALLGKNQFAPQEIDLNYARENDIKVVRRLSGGGTVFCDLNNMQYTFITTDDGLRGAESFKAFAAPVVEGLRSLGLDAEFTGRNDILIDGKKVSGNAQYRYKGRIIHHGTILFDVDKTHLTGTLRSRDIKYKNKAVKSVVSRIGMIKDFLPDMTVESFMKYLSDYIINYHGIKDVLLYDEALKKKAEKYALRFMDPMWNLGKDYKSFMQLSEKYPFGLVEYMILLGDDGKIKDFDLLGDYFELNNIEEFTKEFIGCDFKLTAINELLDRIDIKDYIRDMDRETFLSDISRLMEGK